MTSFKPLIAIFIGARLCFANSRLRGFCSTPWFFGFSIYIVMMITAVYFYSNILSLIPFKPEGVLGTFLFYVSAVTVSLVITLGGMIITSLVVLLATGYYQYQIATTVLLDHQIDLPRELKLFAEFKKSITREVLRLALILPFLVISFLLSVIPVLGILSLLVSAWLTAFPFFDIALEVCGLSAAQSISFCKSKYLLLLVFGLTLLPFWVVPFAPVFLTPFASAGAAWLVATNASFLRIFQSAENYDNN